MLKHVIFDFDGTIVNSISLVIKIGNQLALKYGFSEITEEDIKALKYLSIEERLKKYGIKLYKLPGLVVEFNKNYRNFVRTLELIDGIENLIISLKDEKLNLGIVSSNAVNNISEFLKNSKLSSFDNIYSSKGLFGKHSSIKSYLKRYNINEDDVVYIGDELRDINACKRAGIRIISVTWGFDPVELLLKGYPDFIANSPDEVLNYIKSIR